MSDRQAFIEAICREPGEDTHRLVFADWLDEHGEPERAEFIRVQCEMAGTPLFAGECKVCAAVPDGEGWIRHGKGCYALTGDGGGEEPADRNPEWERLRRRERELLDVAAVRDWAGIPASWGVTDWRFTRGFVSEVRCSADDWLRHADALFWHPGQTVECPECEGAGESPLRTRCPQCLWGRPRTRDGGAYTVCCGKVPVNDQCPTCRGHGTVPRPCPETANPIEGVVLTTPATLFDNRLFSAASWPGVEFVPAPTRPGSG